MFEYRPLPNSYTARCQVKSDGHTDRRVLGAVFAEKMQKLPRCSGAALLWDCSVKRDADPIVEPGKPKFWLLGTLKMESGIAYRIS